MAVPCGSERFDAVAAGEACMRSQTTALILSHFREHGTATRSDVSAALGLHAKTVANAINTLRDNGLLVPAGRRKSDAGRRQELFSINGSHGNYMGLDLGATHIIGILVDANCSVLDRVVFDIRPGLGVEIIVSQLKSIARRLAASSQRTAVIRGAGVCVPGFVDPRSGMSIVAENIVGWRNVHLREILAADTTAPLFVEDSSRALGVAERWVGSVRHASDFMVLDIGYGVGMAIYTGGELYGGTNHKSGEIGHTVVVPDGGVCACGKRGCLETVASGRAIALDARAAAREGRSSILMDLAQGDVDTISAADVSVAANMGDPLAGELLRAAGGYIGIALANAVNLLNPSHVVLGGGLTNAGAILLDSVSEALSLHTMTEIFKELQLSVSGLGVDGSAIGSAMLAMLSASLPTD